MFPQSHPSISSRAGAVLVGAWMFFTCLLSASAADKTVLFLHTNKSNGPGIIAYDKAFQSTLVSESPNRVDLLMEYSDLWRLQDEHYLTVLRDFYRERYGNLKIDVLVADSLPAIKFLIKYGAELFPNVPVVFCITDKTLLGNLVIPPNMTGVLTGFDFGKGLGAALALQPDTTKVVVIGGTSQLDLSYLSQAREEFRQYEGRVQFEYLTNNAFEDIEKRISQLPPHTVVYFVMLYRDGANHSFGPYEAARRLAKAANAPFYSVGEPVIFLQSTGGYVWSVDADAAETAKIVLRILAGEGPQNIPIHVGSTNRYIFDYQQLERWGIPEARVPAGSILRNKELTFWQRNRAYIVGAVAVALAELALVVFLLVQLRRRVVAEKQLRLSEERFLKAFRASPDAQAIVRFSDGMLIDVNDSCEHLFGYSRAEVVGRNGSELNIFANMNERERVREVIEKEGGTLDYEIDLKNKAGQIIQTNISSQIIELKGESCAIAIIRDVSRRKAAEDALRASEDRYRDLVDHSKDLICTHDLEGRLLSVNPWAARVLGYDPDELIGKYIGEVLTPEFRVQFREYLQTMRTRGSASGVMSVQTRDGESRIWEYSNSLRTEGVAAPVVRGMAHDVTETKRAEKALRKSQEQLAGIIESAMDAIITVNQAQNVVLMNAAAEKMFGWNTSEVIGRPLTLLMPERYRLAHNDHVEQFGRASVTQRSMGAFRAIFGVRANGEEFPIEASISQLQTQGERFFTVILRDITERVKAEENLRQALSEVETLKNHLQQENIYLKEEIKLEHNFQEIIGESEALKYVLFKIENVAATDATVLLLGETGTGKELAARAIHSMSSRKDRPLVKVNCATLPANLIESELFGHERGAFTGAHSRKIGRFEIANESTLFLDEIGELPLDLQAKLLRVLQEGEFERLGGSRTIKVNVRIIAATNRDLKREVERGQFREDLWYRLNVFPITMPPLRKRLEDIPLLTNHFVNSLNPKLGKKVNTVSPATMRSLQSYSWPGNVRELANVIERALINSDGVLLELADQLEAAGPRDLNLSSEKSLTAIERSHIVHVLDETGWRIEGQNGAAHLLGLNASTLRTRMRKLKIDRPGRNQN